MLEKSLFYGQQTTIIPKGLQTEILKHMRIACELYPLQF